MKVKYQRLYRLSTMGILLASFCLGCAGLSRTIEDSQVTQKMREWQMALKQKLSFDDDESAAEDTAVVDKKASVSK